MDSAAKALSSWFLPSRLSLSVACLKSVLYLWTTILLMAFLQARWITTTRLVNCSRESPLARMRDFTVSCEWPCWAKEGMSSCMVLSNLMSMLLRYSLKVREWDSPLRRSLVIGRLPPSSDASKLIFSSFETTLSFLLKEGSVLRLPGSSGFFGLISRKEFTWPCLPDLTAFVLPDFLDEMAAAIAFDAPGCVLLECGLGLSSFLAASKSADGPSVLNLRSLKRSGVKVFLTKLLTFFLCAFFQLTFLESATLRCSSACLFLSLISMSQWLEGMIAGLASLFIFLAGAALAGLAWPRLQEMFILIF